VNTAAAGPAGPLGFSTAQLKLLALVAVPAALVPAIVVAGHARRNERVEHWIAWSLLVAATSIIGLVAYWEHCVIREKRGGGNGEGP
jgi:hypothetical protein